MDQFREATSTGRALRRPRCPRRFWRLPPWSVAAAEREREGEETEMPEGEVDEEERARAVHGRRLATTVA